MGTSAASDGQQQSVNRWGPLAVVLPIFVLTRLAIFLAATSATDSQVYYQYGVAARAASVGALFRAYDVEYPQLAVLFSAGVSWLADQLPPGAERLIAARPGAPADVGLARFQVALGLTLAIIDLALLLLVARFARRADPDDRQTQLWRLGIYVAGTAALGTILYDRLDLVIGAVAVAAVAACGAQRSALGYVLLAVGAAFKLVTVVLAPVVVLAARRGVKREAILALGIFALWPVLIVLFGGGDRAFIFLKYHAERGPELGSVYAAPLLLLADVRVGYAFGGYEVQGPAADAVARAAPGITLAALVAALLVAGRAIRRVAPAERVRMTLSGAVLVWLAFILANKVGSPQYLLWLAPLVPLLPMRTRTERGWAVGFVSAGLLATLTYPYLWPAVHGAPVPGQPGTWAGPTTLGFALLLTRWGTLVVLTVWLAARLWQDGSAPLEAERADRSTTSEPASQLAASGA